MAGYNPTVVGPYQETGAAISNATFTTCGLIPSVNTPGPNATVEIKGVLVITAGTGVSNLEITVNRGTSWTDPTVGAYMNQAVVAGSKYVIPFDVADTPGDVAGESYSINVSGNGTATSSLIWSSIGAIVS